MADSKCDFLSNPLGFAACKGGEAIQDIANDAVANAAKSISEAAAAMMRWLNTWWMEAPQPDLDSNPVNQVIGDLTWYTAAFAIIGFLFALGKMVLSQDFKSMIGGIQPVVNLIIVTACYATGITLLLNAGDGLSTWLLDRASQAGNSKGDISALAVVTSFGSVLGSGGWLIFALIELIGSIVNFAFMLFRNILLPVLMVFLPTLAAASGTEAGKQAFAKANGYLIAFICFKPVAAVIYALGLWFMNTPVVSGLGTAGAKTEDLAEAVVGVCTGTGIMILAALALPALIKFLVPVAARGAGGFSGGGALAGAVTVAAGAAVIAATGGAGAAAGGAGTAAGSGAGAGAAGGGAGGTAAGTGAAPAGGGAGAAASGSGGGGAATGGKPGGASAGAGESGSKGSSGSNASGGGSTPGDSAGGAPKPEQGNTGGSAAGGSAGATGGDAGGSSPGAAGGSKSSDDSKVSDRAAVANIVSNAAAGGGSSVEKAIEDE